MSSILSKPLVASSNKPAYWADSTRESSVTGLSPHTIWSYGDGCSTPHLVFYLLLGRVIERVGKRRTRPCADAAVSWQQTISEAGDRATKRFAGPGPEVRKGSSCLIKRACSLALGGELTSGGKAASTVSSQKCHEAPIR